MSNLIFNLDVEALAAQFKELGENVKKDLTQAVGHLATMTHAKTVELAQTNLHSLYKTYTDNLSFENISENIWVVTLKQPALWIEEGRKSGSMYEDLLRNATKTSAEGFKYRSIPFEHSKLPQEQSVKAQNLTSQIKTFLKQEGVPWKKIEKNPDGSPRIGRLHSFNIDSARPSEKAKFPALSGLTIYQSKKENGKIQRDVMTFRVISEKNQGDGRWMHPGRPAEHLFEKSFAWCMETWEKEILPAVLAKYKA